MIKIRNIIGPIMEPYGTPDITDCSVRNDSLFTVSEIDLNI